jgi:molybdopterin converting factor subunit 1
VSTVTVQLFASYADLLGAPTVELQLSKGGTVSELLEQIRSLPGAERLPRAPRVALNRAFASSDQIVEADDEIALIPPVAGG